MKFGANGRDANRKSSVHRWHIRTYLIVLVLACLLPGIIGAGVLFLREYRAGRVQLEKDTLQTARALVQTVDVYLLQAQAMARALASDDSLARGDLRLFHRRARNLVASAGLGINFVLSDVSGQQLVNTLKDFGAPLPRRGNPEGLKRVLATGKPVISDLFMGGVLRRHVIGIDVPVFVDGKVAYVLGIGILPSQFSTILQGKGLPGSWVAAIFDGSGTIVARTHAAEQFIGQKGTFAFIQRIRSAQEGSMETVTREGIPTFSMFSRSPTTNWSVGIGIPRNELASDFEGKMVVLGLGVLVLFGAGFALAWILGGRISGSVRHLQALTMALSGGERPAGESFHVREVADVAKAMADAASQLEDRNQALRLAESRFRRLCDANLIGVLIADASGRIIMANDYFLKLIDHSRDEFVRGQIDWRALTPPEWQSADEKALVELAATGVCTPYEKEYNLRDGSRRTVLVLDAALSGENGAILSMVLDVTERRRAEREIERLNSDLERRIDERTKQLVQAQKMEAVGRLTGGVAHDFNNVLQGLSSSLMLLERDIPPGPQHELFEAAMKSIEHGGRLTQAMLAFSRRQTLVPEVVDVRDLLDDLRPLLERALGGLVRVDFDLQAKSPVALVDRGQLEAAMMNLAINARDAMPAGGRLTVRTGSAVIGPESAGHPPELRQGTYVTISLVDSGIGMDEATLTRVFEPFFTTKPVGRGSGLGLSMVQGMALQSGGGVAIASAVGKGTTVTLYLPWAPGARPSTAPADTEGGAGKVGATVLLVDDDETLRNALATYLNRLNYRVLAADCAEAALTMVVRGERPDVLVTDYAMPGMNGSALIRELRQRFPELPAVLITGYAEGLNDLQGMTVLCKPFPNADLGAQLANLLRGRVADDAAVAVAD